MRTFAQLFAGRTDCFGVYRVTETRGDGKQKGRGITYPNSRYPERVLEDSDWEKHLEGSQMTGIVPVLPTGQCNWFAIDVDDYSVSHQEIVINIEKQELPLVTCRSKSGGAHLYCFIDGLIEASLAQKLAAKWVKDLGLEKCEIFPKQNKFDDEKAKGNWIILPYFNGDKSVDFGIDMDGQRMSLDDFLQWCYAKEIDPDEASDLLSKKEAAASDLSDDQIINQSPPCIQSMLKDGIPSHRNNAAYHFGVYYRILDKALDRQGWEQRLMDANANLNKDTGDGPMFYPEITQVIKNVRARPTTYFSCDQEPQCNLCDKDACRKLKFGIGPDQSFYGDVVIQSITKIDTKPPIWIPKINGVDIEMDTETLMNPRKFRMAVAEGLNVLIQRTREATHDELIGPMMRNALRIEPIEELTVGGKSMAVFQEWTKSLIVRSTGIKDLTKGLPWFDKSNDTIFFRGADFLNEYKRIYRDNTTERSIWSALRKIGFDRRQIRVDIKNEWVWYYVVFEEEIWFESDVKEKF